MKQLLKLSILLCLSPLAFCACDKNDGDDDRGCVYPNPSQPSESIYNYTGEVEFVVDAPQIKEKIEQDLTENPPFGGAKKWTGFMGSRFQIQGIRQRHRFVARPTCWRSGRLGPAAARACRAR